MAERQVQRPRGVLYFPLFNLHKTCHPKERVTTSGVVISGAEFILYTSQTLVLDKYIVGGNSGFVEINSSNS